MSQLDFENSLNDQQLIAVNCNEGNKLVLAGAGSGKTRVLTYRIAKLIQDFNVRPSDVLALTFTNKASREMKDRIESILKISSQGLWFGTFHGICRRILKIHWREAELSERFTILDSQDQLRLIKRILKGNNYDEKLYDPKSIQSFINRKKDNGHRSDNISDKDDEVYVAIFKEYENILKQTMSVDFADLILKTYELFRSHNQILNYYIKRFKHIMVDEFQDTNLLQFKLLKLLNNDTGSLYAVGDDDQSIYGWRGAKVENIKKLQKDFKDIEVFRLEQNYRSTGNILEAANNIILNNDSRMGKNLWTEDKSGDLVKIFSASDETEEANFVIDTLQNFVSEDYSKNEIAILYRSNAQSRIFEEKLIANGIKYRIYGGFRFFERAEIKDVIAYMRLAVTNSDNNSFERIVNNPPRGIGEKTKNILRSIAKEKNKSLYESAKEAIENSLVPNKAMQSLIEFLNIIETISSILQKDELPHQISEIIKITGIKSVYEKSKSEQSRSKLENLDELVSAAHEFVHVDLDENETVIDAFLTHTSLESGEGQGNEWDDCIQLMTLHSSKGLEFPIVFLVGLEENLFPSRMSIEEDNLEEERRLCYVGITRARKKLYISHAQIRRQYGTDNYCMPSRFLNEIPENVVEEIGHKSKMFFKKNGIFQENDNKGLSLTGKRVIHKKFGEGIVTAIEGRDANTRVQVSFDDVGTKWLILAISNLEIL